MRVGCWRMSGDAFDTRRRRVDVRPSMVKGIKPKELEMAKDERFRGAQSKSLDEIKRLWGDVEVVDAAKDLRVFVQPEDVNKASRKDPGCCVFAQACRRQFSATKVLFWRSVAYVELPGPSGKRRVERFILSSAMRDLIESFDKGNDVENFAGFELKRPSPARTFEGNAARQKRLRQKSKKALLKGVMKTPKRGSQGDGTYSKPSLVIDLEVRKGTGRVQFKNEPVTV
jgi:hypothetical protein